MYSNQKIQIKFGVSQTSEETHESIAGTRSSYHNSAFVWIAQRGQIKFYGQSYQRRRGCQTVYLHNQITLCGTLELLILALAGHQYAGYTQSSLRREKHYPNASH